MNFTPTPVSAGAGTTDMPAERKAQRTAIRKWLKLIPTGSGWRAEFRGRGHRVKQYGPPLSNATVTRLQRVLNSTHNLHIEIGVSAWAEFEIYS
jgi:hypothetical protein